MLVRGRLRSAHSKRFQDCSSKFQGMSIIDAGGWMASGDGFECCLEVFQYINGFRNPRWRHSSLGGKSPLAFERKAA